MAAKPNQLTKLALASLAESGLTAGDAQAMGIRSLTAEETNAFTKGAHQVESYLIPYGKSGFARVRFVGERIGFDRLSGDDQKYSQNEGGCRLYLPPFARWQKVKGDTSATLYITEGEKKAASLCKHGAATIGLGGVNSLAREALDELDEFDLKGRETVIVFDAPDITKNINVKRALRALGAELEQRGARVGAKRLPDLRPGRKTGLDDFLVAKGLKAFEALPVEAVEPPQRNNDTGNARRLVARHGADFRHVGGLGWYSWDAGRGLWLPGDAEMMRRAKDTAGSIYSEAAREKDDDRRKTLAKHASATESLAKLKAMIETAIDEPGVEIDVEAFDADPWLLGVNNGAVDLRTGKLRPARREDMLTKSAAVAYDPRAQCPTWEKFMSRVMAEDAQVIAFLRRAFGYSLTADTSEKGLFFLYGPTGDNGKSTFVEFLQTLLGAYSRKVSAEMLMAKRFANQGGARPDLLALVGRRVVVASELSDTQRFDEAFLKDMAGGMDRVDARGLYENKSINFKPGFKLWLYGNHKPQLRSDDDAAWRRLYLVPFDVRIPKAEQDGALLSKLVAESPGILNWALAGLADYRRVGLRPPPKVVAATSDYREEQDWFGRFLDDNYVKQPGASVVLLKGMFSDHVEWCKSANVRPMPEPRFRDQIKAKGYALKVGHANKRFVVGLRMKMAADSDGSSRVPGATRWGTDDDDRRTKH